MTRTQADATKEIESIKNDIKALRDDLKAMGKRGKEEQAAWADRLRKEVQDRMESVRSRVEQAKEYGQNTMDKARGEIVHRPFIAVLVAFVVGWILARIFRRR